jgi:transposase
MRLHGNARLTSFQRVLLCERVCEEGWTVEEAAGAAGCSQRTAYRWLARWRGGDTSCWIDRQRRDECPVALLDGSR